MDDYSREEGPENGSAEHDEFAEDPADAEEEEAESGIGGWRLFLLGAGLLLAVFVLAGAGWWLYDQFRLRLDEPMSLPEFEAEFIIERGDTFNAIARKVRQSGLLPNARPLRRLAEQEGTLNRLQPGIYRIKSSQTVRQLHQALLKGSPARLTFPEGFRLEQFAARLAQNGILKDEQQFLDSARSAAWIEKETELDAEHLEGYLWPDTYDFVPGDTAESILQRLLANFLAQTAELARETPPQDLTWPEVVILASMIEKEAGNDEEKPIIASVYYNRMRLNYRLQCDATVRYGLSVWDRGLTEDELKIETSYNTYLYHGLPPGPICSPGLVSLRAAMKPADTQYRYYCAKGDGTHAFARSNAEHNRNVQKYLRKKD